MAGETTAFAAMAVLGVMTAFEAMVVSDAMTASAAGRTMAVEADAMAVIMDEAGAVMVGAGIGS
ncbi:putative lipoprotein [Pseudomonas savastanoi pv. glycinea]|nr:putative lipoprotein [Pseudomonas savastanoi pv. glycinea]